MNTMACLRFLPNGTAHGLYTEAIDLRCLGSLTITRASTIEFNQACQLWRVFDVHGRCLYSARSRTACVHWEQRHFSSQQES